MAAPRTSSETSRSAGRRLMAGVVVLLVLSVITVLLARHAVGDRATPPQPPAGTAPSRQSHAALPTASPSASPSSASRGVAGPPSTTDPVVFGKAFAAALWSYDTRSLSQPRYLAGLRAWVTGEGKYADVASVTAQVPSPVLWGRMRDNGQYATAAVAEAHLPRAFSDAVRRDPAALTAAYVYAVTVTGRQAIAWRGGGQGAEPRAVTLAVQCRPAASCALAAIAPAVTP